MRRTELQLDFSQAPKTEAPLYLAEGVDWQPDLPLGPFSSGGGRVWAREKDQLFRFEKGRWYTQPFKLPGYAPAEDFALTALPDGTLLMAFMDRNQSHFRWLKHLRRASRNTRSPVYVTRSEDGGNSWSEPVLVQDGYSGAVRSMVALPSGRIVLACQYLLPEQARYVSLTYFSDDGGFSWQASNWLDAGGRGHHDGAIEGYLLPLQDGRLWYLLRTNWDRFWSAWSEDEGATWTQTALGLPASSSPGALLRLRDGRIVLAYNPVGENPPRRSGDFSERAASWYRAELCLAVSEDDGEHWSHPVTIAQCEGAWLSYPHMYEFAPDRLWLTTMQSGLRLNVDLEKVLK